MAILAFGGARPMRQAIGAILSEGEKAMLFDLALEAGGFRDTAHADALSAAPLILAFAQAYVAIRDREDGIV